MRFGCPADLASHAQAAKSRGRDAADRGLARDSLNPLLAFAAGDKPPASKRLDDYKNHDANHQEGRDFILDAEEPGSLLVRSVRKRLAPPVLQPVMHAHEQHKRYLGVQPPPF